MTHIGTGIKLIKSMNRSIINLKETKNHNDFFEIIFLYICPYFPEDIIRVLIMQIKHYSKTLP